MSSFLVSWMPAIWRVAGSQGFMVVVEDGDKARLAVGRRHNYACSWTWDYILSIACWRTLFVDATKKTPQRNALCDIDCKLGDTTTGKSWGKTCKTSGPDQPSAGQPIKTSRKPGSQVSFHHTEPQNENGFHHWKHPQACAQLCTRPNSWTYHPLQVCVLYKTSANQWCICQSVSPKDHHVNQFPVLSLEVAIYCNTPWFATRKNTGQPCILDSQR